MSDGWWILLDCPARTTLAIDGLTLKTQPGFRGFHSVPPGRHVAELEYYSGEKARIEADIAADGGAVWEFFNLPPRFEASPPDRARALVADARAGKLGASLWRFPPAGTTGVWVPPEAAAAAGAEEFHPIAIRLPETPAEKRRYYAIVAALYLAALAGGWLLSGLLAAWLSPTVARVAGIGAPLALVTYVVVRSRGFRLVR